MRSDVVEIRTGSTPITDVTDRMVGFAADAGGAGDGLVHAFLPHATCGLAIIETGAGTEPDLLRAIDGVLPADDGWTHSHGSPGHGRDHVLPALISPSLTLPVIGGRLALGTWQSIVIVDTNVDNPIRQLRLSFVPA